jgi:hypothetical protein
MSSAAILKLIVHSVNVTGSPLPAFGGRITSRYLYPGPHTISDSPVALQVSPTTWLFGFAGQRPILRMAWHISMIILLSAVILGEPLGLPAAAMISLYVVALVIHVAELVINLHKLLK